MDEDYIVPSIIYSEMEILKENRKVDLLFAVIFTSAITIGIGPITVTYGQPSIDQPGALSLLPTPGNGNTLGSLEELLGGSLISSNQTESTSVSSEPKGNISRLIEQEFGRPESPSVRFGLVFVIYESPTMVVLHGDALGPGAIENNINLWKAVDLLRNDYGYNLDNVVVNGIGSSENPDRFYIIMTK